MAGIVHITRDAVTRQLYGGQGSHIIARGFMLPIERFLEGVVRFGRKIGYELPIIAPDNQYTLTEEAIYDTDQIEVDRDPLWIVPGSYITIGGRELHRVEDVSDTTVILATRLLADHEIRQYVTHYGHPVTVEGSYNATQTVINIDIEESLFITRGDVLGITPDTDTDISFVEYTITNVRFIGTAGGVSQYMVTLDHGLHRALTDEEEIQLVAYPAYRSEILRLPLPPVAKLPIVGPYLVDWLSAPFLNGLQVPEYQTLQYYSTASSKVGPLRAVEKNHQVIHTPIRADQLLFWDRVEGYGNYDNSKNKFVAELTNDGEWWWKYTCVPQLEIPATNARGLIVTPEAALLQNNDTFRIPDDVDAVVFEYHASDPYTPTTTAQATGQIQVNLIPSDNDTVTLDDGFGKTITFEFKRTGAFVPTAGYRTVDVTTAAAPPVGYTDTAIALEQAILTVHNAGLLDITASNFGVGFLALTNDHVSTNGNVPIVLGGTITGWPTTGMSGGTDPLETIDIRSATTAIEVAQLTAAAINRTDLHIEATWPTLAPGIPLVSTVDGAAGNGTITENVATAGFIVQGMSGGSGGIQWNFQVEPDQDVRLRIRLYPNDWLPDIDLTGGITTTVPVTLASTDEQVERIDLVLKGAGAGKVYFGDWGIRGTRVAALQHTYVAHVFGEHNFASTGLIIKPIFQSLEDLRQRFDIGSDWDTGGMKV